MAIAMGPDPLLTHVKEDTDDIKSTLEELSNKIDGGRVAKEGLIRISRMLVAVQTMTLNPKETEDDKYYMFKDEDGYRAIRQTTGNNYGFTDRQQIRVGDMIYCFEDNKLWTLTVEGLKRISNEHYVAIETSLLEYIITDILGQALKIEEALKKPTKDDLEEAWSNVKRKNQRHNVRLR